MHARAVTVLGAAFAVAGCSLIYAGDLDDAREVAANLPDGSSASSSGDGGSSGTVAEAGPDSGEGGSPDAGPTGCKGLVPAPRFCEDFDGTVDSDFYFNQEGGKVVVSSEQAISRPNGLKVTLESSKDCQYSRLERSFDSIGTNGRFSVKLKTKLVGPWPDGKTPLVVGVNRQGGSSYCTALFYIYAGGDGRTKSAAINVQSDVMQNDFRDLTGYPSDNAWTELTVEVTRLPNGGARFVTTFQDENGLSLSTSNDFDYCKSWDKADIALGFHCDSGKATVYYDDVRVDWD